MNYKPHQYFNLNDFAYKDIFDQVQYVWDVLPKISDYILKKLALIPDNKRLLGNIHPKSIIGSNVFIASTATVEPYAYIKGPAIIDDNVIIGHSALVRSGSIIGKKSSVGHSSEVKNSILINRVLASHFAYIGDSVLGTDIELGGGVKLANFRLDEKNITIKTKTHKISTNLDKFGSIIGDKTSIGCNSVLNPGTIIGKRSIVFPLTSVVGIHPQKSIIR